ncbi:MAG TPA: hypothetical protein VFM36_03860 [Thermoanaerobaculia bacterium]|nr:hypothetical protein [Thermoanaerobaculia bacterium]
MRFATLVFCCLAAFAAFADEKGERTENRTGEWWNTIETDEEKYVYLTGLRDGALLGMLYSLPKSAENSPCRPKLMQTYLQRDTVLASVSTAALARMLDEFYQDRANARVMVPAAVFYVSRRLAGDPRKVLQDLLESFRKNEG